MNKFDIWSRFNASK